MAGASAAVAPERTDAPSVRLQLRGGHHYEFTLAVDSPVFDSLKRLLAGQQDGTFPDDFIQVPLYDGKSSLAFSGRDIAALSIPALEAHPAMNIGEGHLGGYISARHPRAAEFGMQNGDSATWNPALWRWIVTELGVNSVLDVGCGEGHAARFFAELGCTVRGVDGSRQAHADSVIPAHHVVHDYSTGPYVPELPYDLVWCCEFVEHVHEIYVDNFLATFNSAQQYLFMTAAPPGQPGWHHVNCQPAQYWIDRITPLGLRYDAVLTHRARGVAEHGHFVNSGMVFARG